MTLNSFIKNSILFHIKISIIIFCARIAIFINFLKLNNNKPIIILSGHLLDGNLKVFFDYSILKKNASYDVYYLTKNLDIYNNLKSNNINILYAGFIKDMIKVLNAKCCITSHGPLIPFLKFFAPNIKYIDVWHGTPFVKYKKRQFNDMKNYTAFFLPSNSIKAKYIDLFNFNKVDFEVTGLARHDVLYNNKLYNNRVKEELNLKKFNNILMYSPTWRKKSEDGEIPFKMNHFDFFNSINNQLKKSNSVLILRIHQNSSVKLISSKFSNIINISQQKYSESEKLLTAVDLLISDWSSIITDYCTLDRPIIIIDSPMPVSWISKQTWLERGGHLARNFKDLEFLINKFTISKDLLIDESQIKMKKTVVGSMFDGDSCSRYDSQIKKYLLK